MLTIFESAATLLIMLIPLGMASMSMLGLKSLRIELRAVLWLLSGSLIVVTIWIWIYLGGGALEEVERAVLAVWIPSAFVSVFSLTRKLRKGPLFPRVTSALAIGTTLCFVAAGFYLVPRTFEGQVTQRQFMGPDSIGYANAVAGLLENGSFEALRSQAIASSGHNREYELFDQNVRAVYKIPDKSLSIKTEFITGSLRVGFPGIVALVTDQIGFKHLLTAMNVTAVMFLVIGSTLIYGLLRSRGYQGFVSAVAASLAMINISLLVGFHEGGVAQAFMFSATAAFLVASVDENISRRMRIFFYVAAYVQAMSSYIDMLFVFGGVTVVWWIIAFVFKAQKSSQRAKLSVISFCISALLLAPLSVKLPRFLIRRLADARQGGWAWSSWTELTGLLGISNPYYDFSPDSIFAQLILVSLVFVVVRHWIPRPFLKEIRQVRLFVTAVVVFCICFYVYSRILMDHTTYQWFKLVGTFFGPLSVPMVVLLIPCDSFKMRRSNFPTVVVAVFVAILTVTVSFRFARFYFGESLALPTSVVNEISEDKLQMLTKKYQVFGHYGWQEVALTPFWTAQYLNRLDAGIQPIAREDLPVGLMVRELDCPEWNCLRNVPIENKIAIGSQYLIVDLRMTGSEVRLLTPYAQWIRVNRALAKLNAPYVEGNWTDLGSRLRYKD